jgi:hypothetical protein
MAVLYIYDLGVTYEKHVMRKIEIYEVIEDVRIFLDTELV